MENQISFYLELAIPSTYMQWNKYIHIHDACQPWNQWKTQEVLFESAIFKDWALEGEQCGLQQSQNYRQEPEEGQGWGKLRTGWTFQKILEDVNAEIM